MDMSENSLIEDILRDAANELGISKIANDKNGAPENATSQNGNQDVVSMANSFLQEVEQFKQSLAQSAAGALTGGFARDKIFQYRSSAAKPKPLNPAE